MSKLIKEMSAGENVTGMFLVQEPRLRQSKHGSSFVQARLSDKSGGIVARMWNASEQHMDIFREGAVVKAKAKVESYQGSLNFIIENAKSVPQEEIDISDFMPSTPFDMAALEEEFLALVDSVEDENLNALLKKIFIEDEGFWNKFRKHPAGKINHHAVIGGLLEHTTMMARYAHRLSSDHPRLRHDILVAGTLIHDMGKVYELGSTVGKGLTEAGCLLGHIYMGTSKVEKAISELDDFPRELKMHMLHMVLSHHGSKEQGSPIPPATPEAIVLHHLDHMDAKLECAKTAIDSDPNDESKFTERQRLFGNVGLYKG
jgi:3'-5' exoribonuclease